MSKLRRLVLVRHGETDGNSSSRLHGSGDVALSEAGRAQMRRVAGSLGNEGFDLVVASPLRRSWRAAALVGGSAPLRLEADFREVHFGRWEGRSLEEIEASDPIAYQDWQAGNEGFEYPGGEKRSDFRARVRRGLEGLQAGDAPSVLAVLHKGVIRILVEALTGEALPRDEPALGEVIALTRTGEGSWIVGRRSSNPPGVDGRIVTHA